MRLARRIKKFWVFFSSYWLEDTRHVFDLFARYVYIFFVCLIYRFLFQAALYARHIQLDGFSMPYPVFLVSGLAMLHFISLAVKVVEDTLLSLGKSDLTEWVLISHSSFWELFTTRAFIYFFLGLTEFGAYIFFSHWLVGVPLRPFFSPMLFLIMLAVFLIYMSIGALISCVALIFRKGHSLFTLVNHLSLVFGGIFFPIQLFPGPLKTVAEMMPITHGLKLTRHLLAGLSVDDTYALTALLGLTAILGLLLVSIFFKQSLIYAKKNDLLINEN